MKIFLLLIPLVTTVTATGYYYQEHSSRSSSSSYKNNELQHQTEDESYYSKRGDTEGRNSPKVNTYSQHLEYKNPNHNQEHSTSLDQNRHTEESDAYAARQAVGADGIVKTVSGNRDQYSYHATYGTSGGEIAALRGGTYDIQSHLLSLTQRLQDDLSRQLQNAITTQKNYASSSYNSNTYVESDFRSLESELKSNLTRQLQEKLQRYYGNQVNRGSHSYSIQNGRYSTQANYNTQELEDLRRQLEQNLLQQLRNQYHTQSSSSSSSSSYYSSQNQQTNQQTGQTTYDQTPRAHQSMYRPSYPSPDSFPMSPEVRPVIPLTDVLTQVQTAVDRRLNEALDHIENEYITGQTINYYDTPNFDRILEILKADLKRNLTNVLETTLVEHYGQQEEHNNYYYTSRHVASGSRVANYKADDLESLKQQVLNNLIQKLGNTFEQQRRSYQTNRQSYYQQRQTQESHGYQPTPTNKVYTSYVVFQPSSGDQNARPAYRPSHTTNDEQQPIRYGSKPQNGNYRPSSGDNQPSGSGGTTGTQYTSGSGSYTSGRGYYTTGTIHYPSGSNTYPSSSDTYPSSSNISPTHSNTYPSSSNTYPSSSNTYPSSSNTYPSSSNTYPSRSDNYPSRNENYPSRSDNYPSHGDTYPSRSDTYPSRSDNYPSTSNNYPSNTRTYPSGGGGSNYQQTNYQTAQSSESSYRAAAGHREAGIEYTQGATRPQTDFQAELIDIRDQVQTDLSRQVNTAIEKQRQASRSYSTTSVSSNQVLADLSEELKRNLTQKIEQTLAEHQRRGHTGGYSVTFSTSGKINPGNYNREQLTSMMNQLQEDLLRQLREGLAQDAYRQTSSYSSSGTSYLPVRSHETYGVGAGNAYSSRSSYSSGSSYSQRSGYSSGGECCMQGDDSTTVPQETVDQKITRGDLADNTEDKSSGSVEIEAVPDQNVETSTRTLARNKPSNKPKVTAQVPQSGDLTQQQQQRRDNEDQDQNVRNVGQLFENNPEVEDQHQNRRRIHQNRHHGFGSYSGRHHSNFYSQQNQFLTHEREIPEVPRYVGYQPNPVPKVDDLIQKNLTKLKDNLDQHSYIYNIDQGSHQTDDLTQQHTDDFDQLTQQHSDDFDQLTQQTDDLTQQIDDLTQQTDDLTQQTDDLTQQTDDLTQQTDDLTQQNEDLTQQSYYPTQNHDLTQQTHDLTQQTQDLTQQTQNLAQQLEDLTQNTYRSRKPVNTYVYPDSLPKRTDDLTQQNEDLTQQSEDLTQQNEDLTQQNEDLTQQTEDLTQQNEDLTQQSYYPSQNRDLTQQTQNLAQQSEDLTRDTYRSRKPVNTYVYPETLPKRTDDLTQQNEDLTQQTEDLTQQNEDLTQQSYYPSQSHDLTQQSQDLTQQTQDLTQQTQNLAQLEDLTQNTYRSRRPVNTYVYPESLPKRTDDLTQQNEDLTQQNEDLTQQTEDLTQQNEDLTQQNEDLTQQSEDLTQQTEDLTQQHRTYPYAGPSPQHRSYSTNYRTAIRDQHSELRQVHQATVHEFPNEQLTDLNQQHTEEQVANVVQDVTHQVHQEQPRKFDDVEQITTTAKPGFWKNVGNKISSTYTKAKSSITALG